jgi:hypothetical protein
MSLRQARPNSSATSFQICAGDPLRWLTHCTTASMMSLGTHSIASGISARSSRSATLPSSSGGLVSQTSRSSGRTYRRDAIRACHVISSAGILCCAILNSRA